MGQLKKLNLTLHSMNSFFTFAVIFYFANQLAQCITLLEVAATGSTIALVVINSIAILYCIYWVVPSSWCDPDTDPVDDDDLLE